MGADMTREEAIQAALKRTWGLNVGDMAHPVNLPTFDAVLREAGYVVVPVEPSGKMREAGWGIAETKRDAFETCTPAMIYRAMIDATAKEPQG